jgi:hypothetical protein
MKIWIIWSHSSDLSIKRCIDISQHSCEEFLDEWLLTWENYNEDLIIWRCQLLLDSACNCDCVILPPQCEMLYHRWIFKSSLRVIPLFLNYINHFILPRSLVWKIACFTTDSVLWSLKDFRKSCVKDYELSFKQTSNKYFQNYFPLYPSNTKHWDSLCEIDKKRLVNKLIKWNCKKLKDYAIDSFVITDWWNLYFLPILRKSLGLKVKHPSVNEITQLLHTLLL